MTLTGHLKELRNRIIICVVFLIVSFLVGLHFAPDIVSVLTDIGKQYGYTYIYISPQELLLQYFSVALLAGVIIHDLSKTAELKSDKLGNVSDYTADGLLVGHLVRGVALVDEAARNTGVSGEIVTLLEHMMISHHGIPEFGSPRRPLFPEAEALHWIDTLDAKMDEMRTIQERTPAGAFSERIPYLDDRRMYHPLFTAEPPAPAEAAPAPEAGDAELPF